jgi:hypothetical protein
MMLKKDGRTYSEVKEHESKRVSGSFNPHGWRDPCSKRDPPALHCMRGHR